MKENNTRIEKELRQIRNLLILLALKAEANLDEVHYATGMGAANISRMFPVKLGKRKAKNAQRTLNPNER
jgi:hypothetical protein